MNKASYPIVSSCQLLYLFNGSVLSMGIKIPYIGNSVKNLVGYDKPAIIIVWFEKLRSWAILSNILFRAR